MKIELRGKAKIAAVIALFAAVTGVGMVLERMSNDRFEIETVPGDYSGSAADAMETPPLAEGEKAAVGSGEIAARNEQENAEMVIDGKVNINTASVEVLVQLDGIGESTAEKIIAYREAHGDFMDVHELTEVSGIGEKKLQAIIDKICVE